MSTIFLSVLLHLLTLLTGSTPMQLEPIVISPLSFHLTNTNRFPAEPIALCTSCSPLLADSMANKGQSPTLSFVNVPVTKMFLILNSSRSNTKVKKIQETDEGAHVQENDQSKNKLFFSLHQTYSCSQCFVPYFHRHQKQVNNLRDS